MYEYIWSFAIAATRFLSNCVKKKLFILNMNTKWFPPKYIWSNFVQYLRIHLPWKTDINPNSIRGKSFFCSIDSQLCFTGVQKYIEKMAPRKSYVLRHQVSIFVNIWKKLKLQSWNHFHFSFLYFNTVKCFVRH